MEITDYEKKERIKRISEEIASGKGTLGNYEWRGRLYQELGDYDKALNDFNKVIELEDHVYSRLTRADLYFFKMQRYDEGLEDYAKILQSCYSHEEPPYFPGNRMDLTDCIELLCDFSQLIKLDPQSADLYVKRGIIYFRTSNHSRAINDFKEAVNLDFRYGNFINHLLVYCYTECGSDFCRRRKYRKAIECYSEAIKLDPKNAVLYSIRGNCYKSRHLFDPAIEDHSKTIELDPDPAYYFNRADIYQKLRRNKEATEDYNKGVELDPENASVYLERFRFHVRNEDYGKASEDFKEFATRAYPWNAEIKPLHLIMKLRKRFLDIISGIVKEDTPVFQYSTKEDFYYFYEKMFYDILIYVYPQIPSITYMERGIYFVRNNKYDEAIKNIDKGIELDLYVNRFGYFLRGICYDKIGEIERRDEDFRRFITDDKFLGIISEEREIKHRLLFTKLDYSGFLIFIVENSSIEMMIESLNRLTNCCSNFLIPHPLVKELDRLDWNRIEYLCRIPTFNNSISNIFSSYYPKYEISLKHVFNRDGQEFFFFFTKLSFLKFSSKNTWNMKKIPEFSETMEKIPAFSETNEDTFHIKLRYREYERLICENNERMNFISMYFYIDGKGKELEKSQAKIEHERKIAQARVDERNKVIADLSHSIKNLVSTIIDPLKNLKKEKEVKPAVIDDALKGANLIREIVNAMNLSFRGSVEDFYHDARNGDKDKTDLQSALVESLIYSVGNMFDGKYFPDFQMEYFTSEDILDEAESEWTRISQNKDLQEMISFFRKYFFEADFSFDNASGYAMGNEKGAAIKFLILFQELILNAVKYSAFVSRENRQLQIQFDDTPEQIAIRIENRYNDKINVSTSGIGHVIVENFCKLMETEPVVTRENGIYAVDIRFANFWKEESE